MDFYLEQPGFRVFEKVLPIMPLPFCPSLSFFFFSLEARGVEYRLETIKKPIQVEANLTI
jgi:hypothetical protein